jgi:transposase
MGAVCKWSKRFDGYGIAGLKDAPGRGRKARLPAAKISLILERATRPAKGRVRWSVRSMAREAKVSKSTVQRVWSHNQIKPHRLETFKISNDPNFEEKFWDVIGLYLDPPERALVLCCDEKSQYQALERTQRPLPLKKGYGRTQTHDYIRHGTITLFAALSYLEGKIISRTEECHTHVEWLRFLKQIDRETPKELDLHLIIDNYATHKHPAVQHWLKAHGRFHMHFTPTSSSWLNLVERFSGN